MTAHVKALAVPIFRRYWLWTAWEAAPSTVPRAAATAPPPLPPLSPPSLTSLQSLRSWAASGPTLEERFTATGLRASNWFQRRLSVEWDKLESAREGTLRNWGYRLAQSILAREDPQETFLKAIPTAGHAEVRVLYPGSLQERLVRRRLRHLAAAGHRRHRARIFWWALAMVPQAPLMLTPLPNITVYYTIYRLWSHMRALQGSKALEKGFTALDSAQLRALRDQLLQVQAGGVELPPESWAARLVRKEERYLDIFDRLRLLQKQRRLEAQFRGEELPPSAEAVLDAKEQRPGVSGVQRDTTVDTAGVMAAWGGDGATDGVDAAAAVASAPSGSQKEGNLERPHEECTGMHISFYGSAELDDLVAPAARLRAPLSDEAAMAIGAKYGISHLLELVAKARRRVVGSMFAVHTEEWSKQSSGKSGGGSGGGEAAKER